MKTVVDPKKGLLADSQNLNAISGLIQMGLVTFLLEKGYFVNFMKFL